MNGLLGQKNRELAQTVNRISGTNRGQTLAREGEGGSDEKN